MSTAPFARPTVNPWFIAMAVSIATFMEVLDTSIADVALRHIAGGLSAANDDSERVITGYLAANAAVLLLSGRPSRDPGRRNEQQAGELAYLESFDVFALIALGIIPLALLMRRSVAEPGQHVGEE